jgi:drug/metabolite transporter (DMT)-like permease
MRATPDLLLVALAALAFSVSSPLAKLAAPVHPLVIAAGRTAVATLAIALLAPRRSVRAVLDLTTRQRLLLACAGALLAAHFAAFLGGLARTSLPAAVSLVSLEPMSVLLVAWLFFGLRPNRREALSVVLATVGALVVSSGAGEGEHRLDGDALVLLAVALYGGYVALARGLRDAMPMLPYAGAVYGVATVFLLPFAIAASEGAPLPPQRSVVAIVALGLVPTLIGHTLVQRAARRVSPAIVALVSPGETVGSLLISALVLSELPTRREALGALLVVVAAKLAVGARPTG